MSDYIHYFKTFYVCTAVALPFELKGFIADWAGLGPKMARNLPKPFTRDEWAYLISFLSQKNLISFFEKSFGGLTKTGSVTVTKMARPRGLIAIWLPNNVSLLGPLILVMLSLTGNSIRLKGGSRSKDLTASFIDFAVNNLAEGAVRKHLKENVRYETLNHQDSRHENMAAEAQVRIVFGNDSTAQIVHSLPHPAGSMGFSFVNRTSEAWIEKQTISEQLIVNLIKAFAVYGQVGCTSPRKVILLNGSVKQAIELRNKLLNVWPEITKRPVPMHIASGNVMAYQLAKVFGWDASLTFQNSALLAAGDIKTKDINLPMAMMIVGATLKEAVANLPANIQTIGHSFAKPHDPYWLKIMARTPAKRLVPINRMHHFGPVWDGWSFWEQMFENIEIR